MVRTNAENTMSNVSQGKDIPFRISNAFESSAELMDRKFER
jgi:hypothetical protein